MLLKIDEPRLLADAMSIISELVTEVKAKVSKQGVSIIAIDPANVALVMLKLPASVFSQIDIENEEELGLNLEDLKAVLRRCGSGSSLVMERDGNRLKLSIQDKTKRNFSLALIDIDREDKKIPSLEFNSRLEIPSNIFVEAIEDSAVVADACTFLTSKKDNNFVVEARGTLNHALIEFVDEMQVHALADERAKYSLEYLQKFIKAAKIADKCTLQFSTDYPCRIDFKSPKIELGFILAPRVETGED